MKDRKREREREWVSEWDRERKIKSVWAGFIFIAHSKVWKLNWAEIKIIEAQECLQADVKNYLGR